MRKLAPAEPLGWANGAVAAMRAADLPVARKLLAKAMRLSPAARTLVKEVQQLKGSCPFVYAWSGGGWSFVTEALGKSPAGLLDDGVHQAAADTREWLVIPGPILSPSGGALRIDFTEELWETAYFDFAELRAVDHPPASRSSRTKRWCPRLSRKRPSSLPSAP